MLAVQSVAPQVVLQAPEVGPVTGAWLGTVGSPKELPLHRLSVSSLVQFVDEVPPGHVELLMGFDYLGAALGHRRIEGRDIHAVDDSFIGLADPPSPRYFPNLSHAKSAEGDSMQPEPRFSRCYAPIDLTADVPAGQRPVRVYKLPGRAFLCADGSLYGVVALPSRAVGAKRRFCTDYLLKALQLMRFCLLHLSWPLWPGHVLVLISS